nr:MFS transporter [Novosphingopyxis sp. YJ-S2-01]
MRFLLLYALANAGGAVAYVPLLTILLPLRVNLLAGEDSLGWLAAISFGGAIAASLSNILFGFLSDRTGNRTLWIGAGLVCSTALLLAIGAVTQLAVLIALVMAWQVVLNMMLAPLTAWAGDCVPDRQKGLLGGLLSFTPALGALTGALITVPGFADAEDRLLLVATTVIIAIAPVLLFGRPRAMPQLMEESRAGDQREEAQAPLKRRPAVVRMWTSRLLLQIAEAALFAFLYFWFLSIDSRIDENVPATLFTIVLCVAIPLTLMVGRWSDRQDRPIVPLTVAAGFTVVGLAAMASADGLYPAMAGYALFGLSASVFMALHSSQTLRVLPRPRNRGRDLGIFNLANTVPSLIMPWLTLALVPSFGFSGLFNVLAALVLVAVALLASIQRQAARSD